jgi:hypothetical protein
MTGFSVQADIKSFAQKIRKFSVVKGKMHNILEKG